MQIKSDRIEIALLNLVATLDSDVVYIECCKDSVERLKEYSDSVMTEPALLQKNGRVLKFVGVPIKISNKVEPFVLVVKPPGISFPFGGSLVVKK